MKGNSLFRAPMVYLELIKIRITFAVTLSTLTGYVMYRETLSLNSFIPALGVFLLAASSSALNQIQEKRIDTIMDRTRYRPLPASRIGYGPAIIVVVCLFFAGSAILYFGSTSAALLLGWFSFFWYNAVYTPLKRATVFAVIAGSLIGAIPPVIGWVAAGGHALAFPVLALAFFFYIWQVPHFIMLLLKYGKDYEKAGLPSLTTRFSEMQIRRIIFVWITGTATATFMLPLTGILKSAWAWSLAVVMGLLLILTFLFLLDKRKPFLTGRAFMKINVFLLLMMLLIIFDSILS